MSERLWGTSLGPDRMGDAEESLAESSNRDNVLRDPLSPMNVLLRATHCRNGHPYDETTRRDRNGWRVCAHCPSRQGR